jgi:excisionase family DNA binding protein
LFFVSTVLTLQEVADQLGVHYMTAYRYVRLGLLPAVKSSGVWQVSRDDLDGFVASSETGPVAAGSPAPWSQRFEARLLEGDAQGAWGVVEAAMAAGADLSQIHLEVISPAMVALGARWAAGEIDIAVEHQATVIVQRLLGRLSPRFARRGRTRGAVVIGAPSGESHGLPTAILSDLLRLDGWDVSDLGPDTPAESFLFAGRRADHLVAIGVSVTHGDHLARAAEVCAAAGAVFPGVLIVLGGAAVRDLDHAHALGADAWASSAQRFSELLREHSDSQKNAEKIATKKIRTSVR